MEHTPQDIELSGEVTERITSEMDEMRHSTEEAALKIGELLTQIVRTATEGNQEVKSSLAEAVGQSGDEGEDSDSISDLVHRQLDIVTGFIDQTREFFHQHRDLASQASVACATIQQSASEVSELTKTSQVLAINLRIEAARLGDKGSGFTALGQQVQAFSHAVSEAADKIKGSVAIFLDAMPRMHEQTAVIEEQMDTMSNQFDEEMEVVSSKTDELTDSLKVVLDHVETKNNQILDCSNQTLSHLAFQDPVSQGLLRMQHDVQQMHRIICGESPDFRSLSELQADVGDDGRCFRESGEVELF